VSLERSFALLESFGQLTGLLLACELTAKKLIRSSLDRIQERFKSNYVPRKKLDMGKTLGVWFCTDHNLGMKMNYKEKVQKVEDVLKNWQNKILTLSGKITVIN